MTLPPSPPLPPSHTPRGLKLSRAKEPDPSPPFPASTSSRHLSMNYAATWSKGAFNALAEGPLPWKTVLKADD